MILLYFVIFAGLGLRRHLALQTSAYDLGMMDQAVWNTLHGRPFRETVDVETDTLLAEHLQPILLPLSLFYLVHSGPETLLVLPTLIIALGALPAYYIARDRLGGTFAPLVFAAAYLLYPALEAANVFEFHPVALAPTFLLSAFYFLERAKHVSFFLFALLSVSCKEEIALLMLMMGFYILFIQRKKGVGLLTVLGAALWFCVAVFIVIPHYNPQGVSLLFLARFGKWGDTPWQAMKTLLARPGSLLQDIFAEGGSEYLRGFLLPFSFTSLLSPEILFLSIPLLVINLLNQFPAAHTEGLWLHYGAPVVPFVVVSAILGTGRLSWWLSKRIRGQEHAITNVLSGVILLSSLIYRRINGLSPLAQGFLWPTSTPAREAVTELVALIPDEAVVSASVTLFPWASQRETTYVFPRIDDADYLLIDVRPTTLSVITRDLYASVQELLTRGQFGVLGAKYGYLLLQRGLSQPRLPSEFYGFVLGDGGYPRYPMKVRFGDSLEFLGFDVVPTRTVFLHVHLDLYFRVVEPVSREFRLFTFLTNGQGELIPGTDSEVAAAIWYPTS